VRDLVDTATEHDNVDLSVVNGRTASPADESAEYDAFLDAAQAAGIVIGVGPESPTSN
jgi:hypothetical protein